MREKECVKSTIQQKGEERDKGHTQMNKSKKMSKKNLIEGEKNGRKN